MYRKEQKSAKPPKREFQTSLVEAFIAEAKTWLNVLYVENGRSRRGVDCVGLIICTAKNCGIQVADHAGLLSTPGLRAIMETAKLYCDEQPTKPLKRGSLLLMRLEREKDARHLGIFTGYSIIHCGAQFAKVVEHRFSEEWSRRVKRVFYFKPELICQVEQAGL